MKTLTKFEKLFKGLDLLKFYNPSFQFIPVNKSYSNGEAMFCANACISVEVGESGWDMLENDKEKLIKWGWNSEQEDQYWIFKD